MHKQKNNFAFIDNTNLYKGVEFLDWQLDYGKFRKLLSERYGVVKAYVFIGYIPGNQDLYTELQNLGYTLVFKPTLPNQDGEVKGNCDAELVLQAMIEFNNFDKAVIVTGDGDFQCLVKYFKKENKLAYLLSPNIKRCSSLLKRLNTKHVYLEKMRGRLEK